jgi:hypothetical protein
VAYKISTIRQFKGISQNLALTSGDPSYAMDCLNVIPSVAGLAKLRVPVTLSPAIVGQSRGPDQFALTENATSKTILAFFGESIYTYSLDDFSPTFVDSNPAYDGPVPWSVIQANNTAFLQNGESVPLKFDGVQFDNWGIYPPTASLGLGTPTPGSPGLTLTVGRQYRFAYKNTVTGHVGVASPATTVLGELILTGPLTNQAQPIDVPPPSPGDEQIDAVRLYATLDGGGDYFFHSEFPIGTTIVTIIDTKPDSDLDQTERAPLINWPPPKAKYMQKWGARIFLFNLFEGLDSASVTDKWVAYTGYNRITVGRPEETCPQGNRIKLETGADEITGGGVIDAGVIAFDRTDKMFMFRGQPEDIVITAPVEFSLFLKELPYGIGCASHFTIQSTSYGLIWLGSDLSVYKFNGQSPPETIDDGVEPILRNINYDQLPNCRSAYWGYKHRDWYVLAIPLGVSTELNRLLIFDLTEGEANVGVFPFDIGAFQSINVIEMENGEQKLVIGQGGRLKELRVTADTISGISDLSADGCQPGEPIITVEPGPTPEPEPEPIVFTPCPGFSTVIGVEIDRTQIPSTQTNLWCVFEMTDPRLMDVAHGGFVQHSGFDVRPSLTDCTMLTYELEANGYDGILGKILIWVLFPTVNGANASTNTLFQFNIGNALLTTDGSSLWTGYNSVVHLNTLGGGIVATRDSVIGLNNTDWSNTNCSVQSAQIGNGATFPGTFGTKLRMLGTVGLPFSGTADGTWMCWLKTAASVQQFIAGKENGLKCQIFTLLSGWHVRMNADGTLYTEFRNNGETQNQQVSSIGVVNDNQRHHIAITRQGATVKIYIDKVLDITNVYSTTVNITDDGGTYGLGSLEFDACGRFFNGEIDEAESLNNVAYTADRVAATYNNQKNAKNPSSFYTLDPTTIPVVVTPPLVTTTTFPTLGAFWRSGYFGNDAPSQKKMFRFGRITADQGGIRVKRRLIIDNDVRNLKILEFQTLRPDGKISTNKKARRLSYELRFPDDDSCQNILELVDFAIPVSEV